MYKNFETVFPIISKEKALAYYSDNKVIKEELLSMEQLILPYLTDYANVFGTLADEKGIQEVQKDLSKYHNKYSVFANVLTGEVSVLEIEKAHSNLVDIGDGGNLLSMGLPVLLFGKTKAYKEFVMETFLSIIPHEYASKTCNYFMSISNDTIVKEESEEKVFNDELVSKLNLNELIKEIEEKANKLLDEKLVFDDYEGYSELELTPTHIDSLKKGISNKIPVISMGSVWISVDYDFDDFDDIRDDFRILDELTLEFKIQGVKIKVVNYDFEFGESATAYFNILIDFSK